MNSLEKKTEDLKFYKKEYFCSINNQEFYFATKEEAIQCISEKLIVEEKLILNSDLFYDSNFANLSNYYSTKENVVYKLDYGFGKYFDSIRSAESFLGKNLTVTIINKNRSVAHLKYEDIKNNFVFN